MPLLSTFGAASARSFGGIGAAAAGAGLDIDEAFSTYLYEGTSGSSLSINNGIDLSGEGGLVWTKERSSGGGGHILFSTDASGNHSGLLVSSSTAAAGTGYQPTYFTFNNNGYTTTNTVGDSKVNGNDYVSWTFRKAPKFFDIVTYTGTGSARTVSHNLGSVPGMILIKQTSGVRDWSVYHRGVDSSNPSHYKLHLNKTDARADEINIFNDTEPTSSVFTVGSDNEVNSNGESYVAYLFAHNNSDGGFGPDADQDVIKCGSYTGNGSTTGPSINLGFEPQLVMVKSATSSSAWTVVDDMRGMTVDGTVDPILYWNFNYSEDTDGRFTPQPTGFQVRSRGSTVNTSGETYIYMAIRRGPLAEPESASDVFEATTSLTGARQNGDTISTTLDYADWHFARKTDTTYYNYNQARITGWKYLSTNSTDAEASAVLKQGADQNKLEYTSSWHGAHSSVIDYFFKRAPSFFDVVAYTGNGTAGRTVSHNLGVAPEMIWVKRRNTIASWPVYHSALGNSKYITLNDTGAASSSGTAFWNSTSPTATEFTVDGNTRANGSGDTYIAYLFATVAGVSKVGSYTGNGSSQTIDCGFSSGARFVLIKSSTQATEWNVFDTARGIVSGNDPALFLDNTSAEVTNGDFIDPHSSGFTINYVTTLQGCNTSGQSYIFYAIA